MLHLQSYWKLQSHNYKFKYQTSVAQESNIETTHIGLADKRIESETDHASLSKEMRLIIIPYKLVMKSTSLNHQLQ